MLHWHGNKVAQEVQSQPQKRGRNEKWVWTHILSSVLNINKMKICHRWPEETLSWIIIHVIWSSFSIQPCTYFTKSNRFINTLLLLVRGPSLLKTFIFFFFMPLQLCFSSSPWQIQVSEVFRPEAVGCGLRVCPLCRLCRGYGTASYWTEDLHHKAVFKNMLLRIIFIICFCLFLHLLVFCAQPCPDFVSLSYLPCSIPRVFGTSLNYFAHDLRGKKNNLQLLN